MDLKERLRLIMAEEFGIKTDEELNKAYEALDLSDYGLLAQKGVQNEKRDFTCSGGVGIGCTA